jgi:hypothetical protein
MYFSRLFSRTGLVALLVGLIAACGGGSDASPAESLPVLSEAPSQAANSNVLPVLVDCGPTDTFGKCIGYNVNRLYTSVTICESGSTTRCQTIDHVLVDTGSTGLRLLATELDRNLRLNRLKGASGFALLNCVQFVDSTYAWGTVATADVLLGDKRAASVPLQIVADAAAGPAASACAVGGTAITTTADLGAKGIIGMGLFKDDCGSLCANITNNGFYYTCTDASCIASTATRVTTDNQVKNPVPRFAQDNNGVMVSLPAVSLSGAVRLEGSLIFGINTQPNNQLSSASVITTNTNGYVTTVYGGQSLIKSFFDTGSNGLYFDDTFPLCSGGFYCPAGSTPLSATVLGANAVEVRVTFSIDNASNLFSGGANTVLPTLSGNILQADMFDWGLPFFYGRRVFFGIEGQFIEGQPSSPFYAFTRSE